MLGIRPVTPHNVELLRELSIKTFTDAFARFNTPENMQQYIENNLSETRLLNEINTPVPLFTLLREMGRFAVILN